MNKTLTFRSLWPWPLALKFKMTEKNFDRFCPAYSFFSFNLIHLIIGSSRCIRRKFQVSVTLTFDLEIEFFFSKSCPAYSSFGLNLSQFILGINGNLEQKMCKIQISGLCDFILTAGLEIEIDWKKLCPSVCKIFSFNLIQLLLGINVNQEQ